ncbi:MAG: lysophospholipid acyltransferase family protein, partial [Chlamydiota bacterium]
MRYRIEVEGLESLTTRKGICFFPNHPSEIDPVILMAILGKQFKPRPVVVETMYEMPFIHPIMKIMKAIAIPDFDLGGNDYTRLLAKKALNNIQEVVSKGGNILLYPSGHLKRSPREELKGASGAFD